MNTDPNTITAEEVLNQAHIIVGGNGMCMCGNYIMPDGETKAVGCRDIIIEKLQYGKTRAD